MFLLRYLRKILKEPRLIRGFFFDVKKTVLEKVARETPSFFFIQIGAHDGKSFDPIRRYVLKYGWRGVLVEPQEELFEKLKRNYTAVSGLVFERAAIADHDGTVTFYKSSISFLGSLHDDEWFRGRNDGLAYENRKRFGSSVPMQVPALTFTSLLRKHNVSKIDLLQIDTEGSDLDIIKQIDFSSMRPRMIAYETVHFDESTKTEALELLRKQGYQFKNDGWNVLAYTP